MLKNLLKKRAPSGQSQLTSGPTTARLERAFQAMRYDAERMFRTHEPNAGDSFIHDKRPQVRARASQRSLHPVSRATCLAAGVAA